LKMKLWQGSPLITCIPSTEGGLPFLEDTNMLLGEIPRT
jgi:hypothetical protein